MKKFKRVWIRHDSTTVCCLMDVSRAEEVVLSNAYGIKGFVVNGLVVECTSGLVLGTDIDKVGEHLSCISEASCKNLISSCAQPRSMILVSNQDFTDLIHCD